MIRIAVCDDEKSCLADICGLINSVESDDDIKIYSFQSGFALLDSLKTQDFDIIFLDIEIDNTDGITVGKQIREMANGINSRLIFVTSHSEKAIPSFAALPFNFIEKPIEREHFHHILRLALKLEKQRADYFTYRKGKGEIIRVPLKDIVTFNSNARKVEITGVAFKDSFFGKLTQVEVYLKKMNANSFIRVHRCVIVNLDHVVFIQKNTIKTDISQEIITVSPNYKIAVNERIIDYYKELRHQ